MLFFLVGLEHGLIWMLRFLAENMLEEGKLGVILRELNDFVLQKYNPQILGSSRSSMEGLCNSSDSYFCFMEIERQGGLHSQV